MPDTTGCPNTVAESPWTTTFEQGIPGLMMSRVLLSRTADRFVGKEAAMTWIEMLFERLVAPSLKLPVTVKVPLLLNRAMTGASTVVTQLVRPGIVIVTVPLRAPVGAAMSRRASPFRIIKLELLRTSVCSQTKLREMTRSPSSTLS